MNTQQNTPIQDWIRAILAISMIVLTIGGLITISVIYFNTLKNSDQAANTLLTTLVPLFATWIGTILAFYFGRENFEAASKQYKHIIDKLTPDILDDVRVEQIMIDRKTMVSRTIEQIKEFSVEQILTLLKENNKTRLPILEKEQIKYVIHESTLLKAIKDHADTMTFEGLEKEYEFIISRFISASSSETLEKIRQELKKNPDVKDVFLTKDKKVVGWLTDSLIIRYLSAK